MIILLTYGQPKGKSDYTTMMETWFPLTASMPSAFLLNTRQEALLLPDWLRLRLIRSSDLRLVDAALQDLEPSQLLLFVQSFGIPVASMGRLLRFLDIAVSDNNANIEQNIMDKQYMAQLVEVQRMRGAKNGDTFYKMLTADEEKPKEDEVEMVSPRREMTPVIDLTRRTGDVLTSLCQPGQVTESVRRLFLDDTLAYSEKHNMLKQLQRAVMRNDDVCTSAIKSMEKFTRSPEGGRFLDSLITYSGLSCPLLRIVTAKQKPPSQALVYMMSQLCQRSSNSKSPVVIIAQQCLSSRMRDTTIQGVAASLKSGGKIHLTRTSQVLGDMEGKNDPSLERLLECCMKECLRCKQSPDWSTIMCTRLDKHRQTGQKYAGGLYVDWLELLDPEVLNTCPDLQKSILFGLKKSEDGKPQALCQSYLLSLLIHQSSWSTLHNCVKSVLSDDIAQKSLNSTAVLDFLWSCIHIPKLWQGCDRKQPKNMTPEDILDLSPDQMIRITQHIIAEASQCKDNKDQSVNKRIPLVIKCCAGEKNRIKAIIEQGLDAIKKSSSESLLYQHLLVEVYIQCPSCIVGFDDLTVMLRDFYTTHDSSCQLDVVSHRLLSTLADCKQGGESEERMNRANIACRKLATNHPTLMLRQMPMLSSLLKGRTHFTLDEFRKRHIHTLFSHSLGILELLSPQVFHKDNTSLENVISTYFTLIQKYGYGPQCLVAINNRFIYFLHNLLSHDAQRATKILLKYIDLLSCLSRQFQDFSVLKSLIAGLSLLRQDGELPESSTEPSLPTRSSSPWTMAQLAPFLNRIGKGSNEEAILEVLQDLDRTSERKVELLDHFLADLKRLLIHNIDDIRTLAFKLVMRQIRHKPSCSVQFVPAFMQCLESENQEVKRSVLTNLADFTLLCQEHAGAILRKAFAITIETNFTVSVDSNLTQVDTGTYITEALRLLNMETMSQ